MRVFLLGKTTISKLLYVVIIDTPETNTQQHVSPCVSMRIRQSPERECIQFYAKYSYGLTADCTAHILEIAGDK